MLGIVAKIVVVLAVAFFLGVPFLILSHGNNEILLDGRSFVGGCGITLLMWIGIGLVALAFYFASP